jgi:trimeric autotransporter adhesin
MRQVVPPSARRTLLAVLLASAGLTCRDAGPTGPGRLAPTRGSFAITAAPAADAPGVPIVRYDSAHVELFTIPAGVGAKDTTITFAAGDTTTTFAIGVIVTEVNQRFLLALTLLDASGRVVYTARDTVVSFIPGSSAPPPPKVLSLVYVGPDTAARAVVVTPRDTTITQGDIVRFTAQARRADGSVVAGATIGFSGRAILVDADGTVHATAPGTGFVIARLATGVSDSTAVTVAAAPASLVLVPNAVTVLVGATVQLDAQVRDATGTLLTGRPVTYASSSAGVAGVSSSGLVTALAAGTATITARAGTLVATAAITVTAPSGGSVVVSPHAATLASLGELVALTAVVRDGAGVVLATTPAWTSRAPAIASVASDGVVLARANGTAWIVASSGAAADSALVTVRQLVDTVLVSRDTVKLAFGDTATVTATPVDRNRNPVTDSAVTFTSADPAIATVTAGGRITLVGSGTTRVTASAGGRLTGVVVMQGQGGTGITAGLAYIRITPGGGSVRMGGTMQLSAELVDAAGTATPISPVWASDQPGRAPVSASGLLTLVDTVHATITATRNGVAGHAVFTVLAAPAVTSFTFAPSTLTGASTSTLRFSVSVGAADPGDGVSAVQVEFTGPGGVVRSCSATSPIVGTTRRGTWDCTITLPPGSPVGIWHASMVSIAGTIARSLDEAQLSTYGPTTLTVAP